MVQVTSTQLEVGRAIRSIGFGVHVLEAGTTAVAPCGHISGIARGIAEMDGRPETVRALTVCLDAAGTPHEQQAKMRQVAFSQVHPKVPIA